MILTINTSQSEFDVTALHPTGFFKCLIFVSRWAGHGLCPCFVSWEALFHQTMGQGHRIFYAHVSILIPFVTTPPCLWPLFLSASSPHSSQGEPFSSDSAHTLPVASQDSGNQHKVLTMALEALHNVALMSFPT